VISYQEIGQLNIQDDHIHFCILTTPRDSVSYTMQILKGKSSAWLKKKTKRKHGLYEKESLWARGYFVSTIGLDEHLIRRYVKHQHHHSQLDQPSLFDNKPPPPDLSPVVGYSAGKWAGS
jgi:putative transposase